MPESGFLDGRGASSRHQSGGSFSDFEMSFSERVLSATGAAFLSAVIVNPLDVAKTRLQAQSAGVLSSHPEHQIFPDVRCSPCTCRGIPGTVSFYHLECSKYNGTIDVLYKIIRQEGFSRLWRGTNASLALAIPTVGIYLPCYDVFRNWIEEFTSQNYPKLMPYAPLAAGSVARSLACIACSPIELARTRMQAYKDVKVGGNPPGILKTLGVFLLSARSRDESRKMYRYRFLWTGVGAQLARDVPYSAICWSTLEPIRRKLLQLLGDDANASSIVGANFTGGFIAGSLAAAVTCPLDVAKTWRQVQKDPAKTWMMTTRQTLVQVWRNGGMKGLFAGVGPRVGRAGPSVGIVVSFYEVMKYALHEKLTCS